VIDYEKQQSTEIVSVRGMGDITVEGARGGKHLEGRYHVNLVSK
jgi:hypothetical protein